MMKMTVRPVAQWAMLSVLAVAAACGQGTGKRAAGGMRFEVSFPASVHAEPVTGRVFLLVTKSSEPEPRLQGSRAMFAADARGVSPGAEVEIDGTELGFPLHSLSEIPAGDYWVQAVLNIYTQFPRSDGHTIWAHMDQWEGQDFSRSPGNLISEPQKVHFDASGRSVKLSLGKAIPPIAVPADTQWVKHIKFESKLLSEFWGHPIYIGATVLLPKDYDAHPDAHYPVIYLQGHFSLEAPFGFTTEPDKPGTTSWARKREEAKAGHRSMEEPPEGASYDGSLMDVESGYEFQQAWNGDDFPRMIAVSFQHPTPYFDDSYGINSANAGPYGDAIMTELIPYIEEHYRAIREPSARVLSGGSTGGWGSLALQVYHPDFFGGTWVFYPDPVDFRHYYGGVNLYEDDNAFTVGPADDWAPHDRAFFRSVDGQVEVTLREFGQMQLVLGTQDAGLEWQNYTPVRADGYPVTPWDLHTGKIDRAAVEAMRAHGYDIRDYLARNWTRIGPQLKGKLHIICGDADSGYLNLAVYLLEDFLENTKAPYYAGSFEYGRPLKGHGWQPTTNAELVRTMAKSIAEARAKENAQGNR